MTLQTSGAISLGNLQTEYGGANPISISEYYRGQGLVPYDISSTTNEPASGFYYSTYSPTYYWYRSGGGSYWYSATIYWNSANIGSPGTSATSATYGGWTYYKGTVNTINNYVYEYAQIRRSQTTVTPVNTNVTGVIGNTISLSNFYGGRKT